MELYEFSRTIRIIVPSESEDSAKKVEEELVGQIRFDLAEGSKKSKTLTLSASLSGQTKSPKMLPITGGAAVLKRMQARSDAELPLKAPRKRGAKK